MGAVISHSLVSGSGPHIWNALFSMPPAQLRCSAATRRIFENLSFFKANPRVERGIFMAAPHRGSEIADNWIGDLAQSLFRPDRQLHSLVSGLLKTDSDHIPPLLASMLQQGKLTLSPKNPTLLALAELPIAIPPPQHHRPKEAGPQGPGQRWRSALSQ